MSFPFIVRLRRDREIRILADAQPERRIPRFSAAEFHVSALFQVTQFSVNALNLIVHFVPLNISIWLPQDSKFWLNPQIHKEIIGMGALLGIGEVACVSIVPGNRCISSSIVRKSVVPENRCQVR